MKETNVDGTTEWTDDKLAPLLKALEAARQLVDAHRSKIARQPKQSRFLLPTPARERKSTKERTAAHRPAFGPISNPGRNASEHDDLRKECASAGLTNSFLGSSSDELRHVTHPASSIQPETNRSASAIC